MEFVTCTTSFGATRRKLKKICSTYGVPEIFPTDNRPLFNSRMFAVFTQESGFKHKQVTPVKLRDSIRWLTKLLPSQDKKTKPCRTPRDNLRVVKTATYLVSFSRLVCLAFLYGWCLLNKVHVYLAWLLTLITQPSLSKLSDDPECTVCSKHIEALTTKQVR